MIDNGDIVTQWRAALDKYTKMPGIRGLHDLLFAKNRTTGDATVQVCELCYEGPLKDSTIKVASGHLASDLVIPMPLFTYQAQGLIKDISSSKLAYLVQMLSIQIITGISTFCHPVTLIDYTFSFSICVMLIKHESNYNVIHADFGASCIVMHSPRAICFKMLLLESSEGRGFFQLPR